MAQQKEGQSISEIIARWSTDLEYGDLPDTVKNIVTRVVLDGAGLMVAARNENYVRAVVASSDGSSSIPKAQ